MVVDETFIVAIAFIIFVVLMLWKGMSKITKALDKRADDIRRQLDEAQKLREEAQAALAGYQRQQRDALAEAEDIIALAQAEVGRMKADAEKNLAVTLKRREEQAMERIAQAEAKAMRDVRDQAVDLAIKASAKLISDNMSAEVLNRMIADSTAHLAKNFQ